MNGTALEGSGSCKTSRRPTWDEMSFEQRIEEIKQTLIRTQRHMVEMGKTLNALTEHDHLSNKIVTRMKNQNEESCGGYYFRVEEFK